MTTILNIIYKLGIATNIITSLSLTDSIKIAINIFVSVLSCSTPCLSKLK
jgi:hypothetical protein